MFLCQTVHKKIKITISEKQVSHAHYATKNNCTKYDAQCFTYSDKKEVLTNDREAGRISVRTARASHLS